MKKVNIDKIKKAREIMISEWCSEESLYNSKMLSVIELLNNVLYEEDEETRIRMNELSEIPYN